MNWRLESILPWRFGKRLQKYHLGRIKKLSDRRVARTRAYPSGEDSPHFEVHSLLGSAHVGMCLWSIKSFLHYSGRRFRVVLHDDGSLTPADVVSIQKHIPGAQVLLKPAADQSITPLLHGYPHLEAYRFGRFGFTQEGKRRNLFALKILDFNLLTNATKILVLDTDVLFFKPPKKILDWIDGDSDECLYCFEDYTPVYGPSGYLIGFNPKTQPRCYFNSGLICFNKSVLDLSALDRWLASREREIDQHYIFEQRAYNFIVHQSTSHQPLPSTYSFNYTGPDCTATHFGIKLLFFENLPRLEFFTDDK